MDKERIERLVADWEVRRYYRLQLTMARAEALADAEGAEKVIFAIENFGRYLSAKSESLEQIGGPLKEWVKRRLADPSRDFDKRLDLLRYARNERMHKGFAARNLTRDAVRVALILEDSLKVDWKTMKAHDVMTTSPMVAELWMTFGQVRDLLIENGFSQIPIRHEKRWFVITERKLADVVRCVRKWDSDIRNTTLLERPEPLGGAVLLDKLKDDATPVSEETSVLELSMQNGCLLVHRNSNSGDLVGIITPSDIA